MKIFLLGANGRTGREVLGLEDGPEMYNVFRNKQDSCIKVVLNV